MQEMGQADAAAEQWRICAERSRKVLPAQLALTRLHQARKNREKVLQHFLAAAEEGLHLIEREVALAKALLQKGNAPSLAKFAKQLNQQLPLLEELHGRAGVLLLEGPDHEEAYFHLLLAHFASPADSGITVALAEAARRCGKLDYARRLAAAAAEDPDLDEAGRTLARSIAE
jgi:hypothetical protein